MLVESDRTFVGSRVGFLICIYMSVVTYVYELTYACTYVRLAAWTCLYSVYSVVQMAQFL